MQRANNAKISHHDAEFERRQKNHAPFVSNTTSVLTIPKLSPEIEYKFNPGVYVSNTAALALNLMRKGLIDENAQGETSLLIKEAIQKWAVSHAGEIEIFDFELEVSPELSILEYGYEEDTAEFLKEVEKEYGKNTMFMNVEAGAIQSFNIGKTLQDIEAKVEGLGQTAYYWLAVSGSNCLDIYTPWRGADMAEQVWWMGMDSEEDYFDEMIMSNDGDVDDELLNEIKERSPDTWRAAFPKWVTSINNALSEDELQNIANAPNDSLETRVAKAVLKLIENKEARISEVYPPCTDKVYSAIYLHWDENDMSHRLVDDYFEQVNSSGGEGMTDSLAAIVIPSKPFQFRKWMAEMEKALAQLKNIEQLIKLIGTQ